jgi:hypothetical protein
VRGAINNERNRSGTRRVRRKSMKSLALLSWPWMSENNALQQNQWFLEMARQQLLDVVQTLTEGTNSNLSLYRVT